MNAQPFEIYGTARANPVIFVCDHASNSLPAAYGDLGLTPAQLQSHIGYDIGAAHVTRALCESYSTRAVLARWSRLLVDLNRGADDPTIVMKLSDGSIIPGNRHADAAEVERRISLFHAPYHAAIEELIGESMAAGHIPALISIHSFTPVWKGFRRPWEIGILWDRDGRLARPLLEAFSRAKFVVGDNEPYSGELENDCMYAHGTRNSLPHVLVEIRQDLVATARDAQIMAGRIKPAIDEALTRLGEPATAFSRTPY